MRLLRRSLLLTLMFVLALFIAACGSTPSTGTSSSASTNTTPTARPADIQNNQDNNQKAMPANAQAQGNQGNTQNTTQTQGNAQQNTQAQGTQKSQGNAQQPQQQNNQANNQNASANTKTLIATKQVQLNGQMVTILTTFDGQTLYTYNADMAPNSNCTGACAKVWPPLLSNGTVIPTSSIGGTLSVQTTANGQQVEYNGHPLYTYSGDMAAGQVNGQGMQNMWQVAAVKLQKQHW